jgi:hypothetical protein
MTLTVGHAIDAYEQSAKNGGRSGKDYAAGVVDALVAAGLIVLDGIDAKLGRDGLNEGIARAIVAALDAKRA